MAGWNELLRAERKRQGAGQARVAAAAGVSIRTVERYEAGGFKPVRATLIRLGRALQLPASRLNAILTAAGSEPRPQLPGRPGTLQTLQATMATFPWPSLMLNERVEIVAWNRPARLVAELDFASALPLPHQRNLIRIAMLDHFVQRVINWRDVVAVMVNMFAGNQYDFFRPDKDPIYFKAIVDDAAKVDGAHFNTLMQLWMTTPARDEESRTALPVHWRLSSGQELRFNCVIATANRYMGAQQFDWFPADATTWEFLADGAGSPAEPPSAGDGIAEENAAPSLSTGELLQGARRGSGLIQRQLAERSGLSASTIASLERGRRRLTEPLARPLVNAMRLDGVITNELLLSVGLDPEPSDWARFVAGQPQRHGYFRYPGEERAKRARAHVAERIAVHPWPCMVVDERCRILSANAAFMEALPAGAGRALRSSPDLVRFLFSSEARAALAYWSEAAAATLAGLQRQQTGGANHAMDAEFVVGLIEALRREEPSIKPATDRLAELLSVPAPTERVVFPVVVNHRSGGQTSFISTVARWNDFDSVWVIDWHPADAATWTLLSTTAAVDRIALN